MRLPPAPGSPRRAGRPWPIAAAVFAGLLAWSLSPVLPAEAGGYRGLPLVVVLQELQDRGLDLIFSSAVVDQALRVTVEPRASDPRAVLDEILLPLGLKAEGGPGGSVLILPRAPNTGKLQGSVRSMAGKRPIAGASVHVDRAGDSALTDTEGAFAISEVPAGRHEVVVSAPGFKPAISARVRIHPDTETELNVELEARPAFVTEVVVTPSQRSVVRQEQASVRTVTSEEAVLVPTIGGDITRVVELLPGVAAADNSAAFNVRGSVAEDASMVLDGLELYDPFHLNSFQSPFSLIDSNVVDRIDFFGGGFTADLGDRHGGFVEITTMPPETAARGEVELGSLNSRVSYRAPMRDGSGAWLVSARYWYPEALLDTTELGAGENLDPRFGDIYTKAAFNLSRRHRVSAHLLFAYDRLTYQEKGEEVNESVDARTRNGYVWLRALSAWSERLTSETVVSGGQIERERNGVASEDGPQLVRDDRDVDFYGARHDSTWQLSGAHALKAGADVRWLSADYRYSNQLEDEPVPSTLVQLGPDGTSLGVYLAYRARIRSRLATELGLRWDRQTYLSDNQVSPRFNAFWRVGTRSEIRLALGRFSQSQRIHELHVEDGETEFGPAEISDQAELSFRHRFRSGIRFRLDAYYRKLTDLRPRYENLYEPVELFPEATEDRELVEPEEARLQGVELLVRGNPNRSFFWWVSYTYASADDIIEGRDVPRSWDQPHAGKFLVGYRRDGRWSISLSGTAHTGWPTTPATAELLPDGEISDPEPGERNSARYPGYGRVDLKLRRAISLPRGRIWLTAEVVNLTDRDNVCCLDEFETELLPDDSVRVTPGWDYWLGTTPSFNILWEF